MAFETIDGGPDEPDWLLSLTAEGERSAARKHWAAITAAMRTADTITAANGHAIGRLVIAQTVFDRASAAVARDGAVRRVKGVDRRNPHWMIMKQANELCSELEGQLGLSPRTRHRVGRVVRGVRRSAADKYLRPVK
ncbi:P27 family phage terminase small subunit [Bradyrhizobium sp. Ash2021]|uniref:P27 family phage terminase small subunit n=1 Tax=Bradyrhizobium sp. Ash2021 TaxID=2954771 RepID=UPI0028166A31|nr:P27 family phage terminase small subunit [Bradyrhizobium sp. Ash2021]WMT78855.1 P27 family phage terminase small subunit [Bradyrhizobium sp. Ash2021]